jgi:hypothetical protein
MLPFVGNSAGRLNVSIYISISIYIDRFIDIKNNNNNNSNNNNTSTHSAMPPWSTISASILILVNIWF